MNWDCREREEVIGCEQTEREVKVKADGRAGTCLTLKSVWSRFPHVFKTKKKSQFCTLCQKKDSLVLTLCDRALPLAFHS